LIVLPICLVTGFLGTGKTTFLKNFVAKNRDRKIVYLINEFSAHDVDGTIVSAENPNVVSIPGGSIFCRCLVTEFIGQLSRIVEMESRIEGVVIEASGTANPKVIEEMLTETRLDPHFRLATIISVIDPDSFLTLRHTLPNIIAQIEAADVVLINKTDCNPPGKIAEAETAVREINPAAERIRTVQCNVELDLFVSHSPRGLQGEYAKCRDPNYETLVTKIAFDGAALEKFVLEHADDIYRVKGTLTDEFFDYSTAGVIRTPHRDSKPACAAESLGVLAWIVKGGAAKRIHAALDTMSGFSLAGHT